MADSKTVTIRTRKFTTNRFLTRKQFRRRRRRRTERNLPSEIMTDSKAGTIGKFTTNWLLSRKQFIIGLLHPGRLNVSKVNQYGLHISKSAYTCFEFLGTGGKQKPIGISFDCGFCREITSCTSTLGEEGYKLNVESQIAKFAADILSTLKISEVKIAYEVIDVDGYLERTYLSPAPIRAGNRIDG